MTYFQHYVLILNICTLKIYYLFMKMTLNSFRLGIVVVFLLLAPILQARVLKNNHENKVKRENHKLTPITSVHEETMAHSKGQKLSKYDPKNLNQTAKQVDDFIRNNLNITGAQLTGALGNGQTFVYTYENRSQYKNQTWVISAEAVDQEQDEVAEHKHKEVIPVQRHGSNYRAQIDFAEPIPVRKSASMVYVQPTLDHRQEASSSATVPAPVSKPSADQASDSTGNEKAKYRITGLSYIESSRQTEEEKKKQAELQKEYNQKIENFNKKWGKLREEQEKELKQINSIFGDDDDDFWWHK